MKFNYLRFLGIFLVYLGAYFYGKSSIKDWQWWAGLFIIFGSTSLIEYVGFLRGKDKVGKEEDKR